MIGENLAHYEIQAELGQGGMGTVYRALDTRLGRAVALKVLPREWATEPDRLERFRREARALAALDHPNIVTVYSVEHATSGQGGEATHFLTMELVKGQSLDDLRRSGMVTPAIVLDVATQLAAGLAAAHEKGIIHRDLKPANVMWAGDGRVKILDFGLAKVTQADPEHDATEMHTEAGVVMGTAPYMSPEQAQGKRLDRRTDIFSLGSLLYELATGERPFRGANAISLITAILRDEPPPVSSIDARLPSGFDEVIRRCLMKQPDERYEDAGSIIEDLTSLSGGAPVAASPEATVVKKVVVLPFVNRSGDSDNEYFSDGLTEEVIADLSRVHGFSTISRNSAMTLKGTTKDSPTLARELGVSHLVTGAVRRAGNALRVTAELVEAGTDTPLWSEKYSGTVEDVFGIQEEIARKIVAALEITLSDSEERQVAERPIDDALAYDCFLRARQEMLRWTPDALTQAGRLVDEALEHLGENALLLATRGAVHWTEVNIMVAPKEEGLARATELADRALEIDPALALGFQLRGMIAGMRGEVEIALRELRRAYELDPGDANILVEYCRFSNAAGLEGERALIDRLARIDPLSHMAPFVLSTYESANGNFEAGARAARVAIERAPAISNLHVLAGWQVAESGSFDEARGIIGEAADALAGTLSGTWARFLECALAGDVQRALANALPKTEGIFRHDHFTSTVPAACARLGLRDDALHWLREAIAAGYINYPSLSRHDPFLKSLHGDSEFQALMAELEGRWNAIAR